MNTFFGTLLSSALLCALSQTVLAVTVIGQPALAVKTTTVTERGGTVTAIDLKKNVLTVDNVKYALPVTPIVVNASGGGATMAASQLKPGMKIRFNTSKDNYAAQVQVSDIWVVGVERKAPLKK